MCDSIKKRLNDNKEDDGGFFFVSGASSLCAGYTQVWGPFSGGNR